MNRLRRRKHTISHDNADRWLVSYADYMTLLFALFVVLYAMGMVNDKPLKSMTDSLGQVFQENKVLIPKDVSIDPLAIYQASLPSDPSNNSGVPSLTDQQSLSSISNSQTGNNLFLLEDKLKIALNNDIDAGYAELKLGGDWLEIELSSALLFASGSSSVNSSAIDIITVIYSVIGDVSNYIRIRGYTDNQKIKNEFFNSNWELSVYRAAAILDILEQMTVDPARMAIEGYGQYYPSSANNTEEGRAKNRRVVIAVSKYGLDKPVIIVSPDPIKNIALGPSLPINDLKIVTEKSTKKIINTVTQANDLEDEINIIRLNNGGLRITTRDTDDDN